MGTEMREGGKPKGGTESSEAVRMAAGKQQKQGLILAPETSSPGVWCYERLKRSTTVVRIRCDLTHLTLADAGMQFQKFVDHVTADTLLACAVLEHHWGDAFSSFKNGSVVEFVRETRNL
jgi:hypothetical protein